MSEIINPTPPMDSNELPGGGLELIGMEDEANELEGSEQSDSITGGNLADILSGLGGDDTIRGLDGDDTIFGGDGNDSIQGNAGNDSLVGNAGSDTLEGGDGDDTLIAGNTEDVLDGGAGRDLLIASGGNNTLTGGADPDRFEVTISQQLETLETTLDRITDYQTGEKIVIKGNTPATNITYNPETGRVSLDNQEVLQLQTGLEIGQDINLGDIEFVRAEEDDSGNTIGLEEFLNDPTAYMDQIRDFDGNDVNQGNAASWKIIGSADVQNDGDEEQVLVNPEIGRWATVGADENGRIDFSDNGQGGDTRVVGIYVDPLVDSGEVEANGPFDSQRRFQNDLFIDNLSLIEDGDDDYDKDGFQEVYFRVNDGTAVLRALMHADGNIQYANYQSAADLEQFMTENGIGEEIWGDWI